MNKEYTVDDLKEYLANYYNENYAKSRERFAGSFVKPETQEEKREFKEFVDRVMNKLCDKDAWKVSEHGYSGEKAEFIKPENMEYHIYAKKAGGVYRTGLEIWVDDFGRICDAIWVNEDKTEVVRIEGFEFD